MKPIKKPDDWQLQSSWDRLTDADKIRSDFAVFGTAVRDSEGRHIPLDHVQISDELRGEIFEAYFDANSTD